MLTMNEYDHESVSTYMQFKKNLFLSDNFLEKSLFPKCLRRTSEPIRDLENSRFLNFKIAENVFPQKCRGIIPTSFLYSPPVFFLHFHYPYMFLIFSWFLSLFFSFVFLCYLYSFCFVVCFIIFVLLSSLLLFLSFLAIFV